MGGAEETMRLLCSHGGRLVPCGPSGLLYVGGETRALAVPRGVPFRELTARLAEKAGAGGDTITAVRYRLADEGLDEDLLVSVTSDEELAHMRDEYDHLKATRPSASFRVFVSTAAAAGVQQRRPPVAPPMMRRARSKLELAGLAAPPPMRRVHSAQELAAERSHSHQCFYDRRRQSCCCCRRRRSHAPPPVRPLSSMSKNVNGARQAAPAVSAGKATGPVVFELENRRACWEFRVIVRV